MHADDVGLMVWLIKRFRRVEHIERALDIWRRGDELIAELQTLGSQIRVRVTAGESAPADVGTMIAAINPIHAELDALEEMIRSGFRGG